MAEVNGREHRVTRRPPVEMLTEERHRLHALPEAPYTAALGETRKVSWNSTISFGAVTYSVPHTRADETVWVRVDGDHLVVTLGHEAVEAGLRVYYSTAADLAARCRKAAIEGRWATTMRFFAGPAVLIIDELGYLVGARNGVVAGQAACLYSLMRPSQRVVRTTRGGSGWSVVLLSGVVCRGGRWFSERWGRCVLKRPHDSQDAAHYAWSAHTTAFRAPTGCFARSACLISGGCGVTNLVLDGREHAER